jgi:adenylate kinase family enzyme
MRIAIAGGPRCGKTTLAAKLGDARHTDDVMSLGWSEASAEVAAWFDAAGPWIIEGVAVPRALRKWLASHPEGKPVDVVYWLGEPFVDLTKGQSAMDKGCSKVWREIEEELRSRGVAIR